MLIVINRIWPEPGSEQRLEEAFSRSPGMKDVPGCLGFEFWRREATGPAGHPGAGAADAAGGAGGRSEYLVVTRWESREAFEAWRRSAHFQHAHRDTGASAGARSELAVYEVLRRV
ncbi:antibiotic biosynthesis monooxygenase family protein [Thermaerobacter subterraneus]|uniref:Enzyme involved in biosynthesis of extracellular polysaccharides n=1 Tax=Thermaerobacter subterraneus DSM 13965 TaxID=867903 RepID=K6P3Q1_9FIRM|nr:antibiotic biosynthesis monooxygenase [Thermaerobacter subterraneus]EKP95680.1 putative enzyme involved in biosynthesis of extracellular polysaccharides [Thermaerobacter subterraneus DSM 13965]